MLLALLLVAASSSPKPGGQTLEWIHDLGQPQWKVRLEAAWGLGRLGPAAVSAVPALAKALEDEQEAVRVRSAWALGEIGPGAEPAIGALVEALRREEASAPWAVPHYVVRALGRIGGEGLPALADLAQDPQPRLRDEAGRELRRAGRPAIPALRQALRGDDRLQRRGACVLLGGMGVLVGPALRDLASVLRQDPSPTVRLAAARSLSELGFLSRSVADALRHSLSDEDPLVRAASAEALGKQGTVEAWPELAQALKDPALPVRHEAAVALGRLGPEAASAAPLLAQALKENGDWVAEEAARSLGQMGRAAKDQILVLDEVRLHGHVLVSRAAEVAERRIDPLFLPPPSPPAPSAPPSAAPGASPAPGPSPSPGASASPGASPPVPSVSPSISPAASPTPAASPSAVDEVRAPASPPPARR